MSLISKISGFLRKGTVITTLCVSIGGVGGGYLANIYVGRERMEQRFGSVAHRYPQDYNIVYEDEDVVRYRLKPLKRTIPIAFMVVVGGLFGAMVSEWFIEKPEIYHRSYSFPISSYYDVDEDEVWDVDD